MIIELNLTPDKRQPRKLRKPLKNLRLLLEALRGTRITEQDEEVINTAIHSLNHYHGDDKGLVDQVRLTYKRIYSYVIRELKLVPKKYYQNLWMGLGMAVFGIPIGVAMSSALGNFAFIGVGPAIGLSIGLAIGMEKDKRAAEEGRQIDYEG